MQENGVHPSKPPDFKWNIRYTSAGGVTIDRTSWITYDDGKSVIYKLDSNGLPMLVIIFLLKIMLFVILTIVHFRLALYRLLLQMQFL